MSTEEQVVLTDRLFEQMLTQQPSQDLKDNNHLLSERNRHKNLQLCALKKKLAKKLSYFWGIFDPLN